LNITTEAIEPCQVRLTVSVDPARLERSMQQVAQEYSKRYKVPGFRPGKVPLARMVALVGEESLRAEALEKLGREVMAEAMQQEGAIPSAPVSIEITSETPPTFAALVPLEPKVELGEYRSLRMPEPAPDPVTDDEVEALLERLRQDLASLEPVDRPAEAEDVVELALTLRPAVAVAGASEEPIRQHDHMWLTLDPAGADRVGLPEAVIDEIIGLSAGSEHRFQIEYPEDWADEEQRGRLLAFELQVAKVSAVVKPGLDDAFAQQVSDAADLEELRGRAHQDIEQRRRNEVRDRYLESLLDKLVEGASIAYAPPLLESEARSLAADLRERVERQGFTWERWLELQEKQEEELWSELEAQADRQLRRNLVMGAFVDAEAIEVSADEIRAEVSRFESILAGMPKKNRPKADDLIRRSGSRLLTQRAIDRLLEIVSGSAAESENATESKRDTDANSDTDAKTETAEPTE
jgi:trigger factor